MFEYRPFLNIDPPHIVDVWRQQSPLPGQLGSLSTQLCEQQVFSKPYFDPAGLFLAFQNVGGDKKPAGFVHAGFSKNETGDDLDQSKGIVSMLKVVECENKTEVAAELLRLACDYLNRRGAKTVYAGSAFPHAPFYQGIYGGSRVPGVIEGDATFLAAVQGAGFRQTDRVVVWQRALSGFRPIGGREQLMIRRKYRVNSVDDPAPKSWWENCIYGVSLRERFSIFDKRDQVVSGGLSFWDMKPMYPDQRNVRGAFGLNVPSEFRRSGIATFLLGDAIKSLMQDGVEMVEAHTRESNFASSGVFEKCGFEAKYFGLELSREL